MKKNTDLTQGSLSTGLIKLSLPIIATSFMQMAYSLIDTMWIGQLGSNSVAAVGTSGHFLWIATSLAIIAKVGGNVKVSQSIGSKDIDKSRQYVAHAIVLNLAISLLYAFFIFIFCFPLIRIFNLGDVAIEKMAVDYLLVVAISFPFYFFNPVASSIITASGNSKIPFVVNGIGLVFNIVLDPILIFGFGFFPALGVIGAGLATALSQVIVSSVFIVYFIRQNKKEDEQSILKNLNFKKYNKVLFKEITYIGFPPALQSTVMSLFAIVIARRVALWGPAAIAAQKIGSQIESIAWMSCEGFAVAVSTMIGQNYGARFYDRIKKIYKLSIGLMLVIGFSVTILLYNFGEELFRIFIDDAETINIGVSYLKILAISQTFMCIELATSGAFNGVSRPIVPAVIIMTGNAIRIPLMLLLTSTALGLDGIWWSISGTSIAKGTILLILFTFVLKKKLQFDFKDCNLSA